MPFTLAHPALVVPLRRWLALGALACGALAPDAGYYLPSRVLAALSWYPSADVTHTLLGALGIDAVVGLVIFVLWRIPVRPAVLGALPDPWRSAALRETAQVLPGHPVPVRLLLLYVSSAAGALLHVVLDIFTHERPQTPEVLVDDTVLGLPIASFLQWALSVVGLILLAWWGARWASAVAPLAEFRAPRRLVVLVGGALVAGLLGAVVHLHGDAGVGGSLTSAVVSGLVGAVTWGWIYLLLGSAVSMGLPQRAAPDRGDEADSPVSRRSASG